jgi:hypothetical protein
MIRYLSWSSLLELTALHLCEESEDHLRDSIRHMVLLFAEVIVPNLLHGSLMNAELVVANDPKGLVMIPPVVHPIIMPIIISLHSFRRCPPWANGHRG